MSDTPVTSENTPVAPESTEPTTAPEPTSTPATTPEPTTAPAELNISGLVDQMVELIKNRQLEATTTAPATTTETPEPTATTPEPTTAPATTPEPNPLEGIVRELAIKSYAVPETLVPLLPKDPQAMVEFLNSTAYGELANKLRFTATTPEPTTAPEPTPEPESKNPPSPAMPKTFNDEGLREILANALKGIDL